MPETPPLADHDYQSAQPEEALVFLKRTRSELRTLRKVHIWVDRFRIYDVNGDFFEVRGIGYPHVDIIPLLDAVDTVYTREKIHESTAAEYKEFKTGRRYPWAADRVM